jgi:hypothetical protein
MCVYLQQDGALALPTAANRASSSFCQSKSAEATGRAGSVMQRRRRLGCACLHPVDQAESRGAGGGVEPPARLQFENCTARSGVHCRVCGLNVIARILTRRAETPKVALFMSSRLTAPHPHHPLPPEIKGIPPKSFWNDRGQHIAAAHAAEHRMCDRANATEHIERRSGVTPTKR